MQPGEGLCVRTGARLALGTATYRTLPQHLVALNKDAMYPCSEATNRSLRSTIVPLCKRHEVVAASLSQSTLAERNRRRGGGEKAPPEGQCTLRRLHRGLPPPTVPGKTHRSLVCHSANLHRLCTHTRSTGITLNRRIRVSVFSVPMPKTYRWPPRSRQCRTI
jgi:hypothetical protein